MKGRWIIYISISDSPPHFRQILQWFHVIVIAVCINAGRSTRVHTAILESMGVYTCRVHVYVHVYNVYSRKSIHGDMRFGIPVLQYNTGIQTGSANKPCKIWKFELSAHVIWTIAISISIWMNYDARCRQYCTNIPTQPRVNIFTLAHNFSCWLPLNLFRSITHIFSFSKATKWDSLCDIV